LPEELMKIGGWPNEQLVQHFVAYADLAFKTFGDRVKTWITFNEPYVVCVQGYLDGVSETIEGNFTILPSTFEIDSA
jgi:beta-glucosidase/6-phospho-beta-glucosidase/beta-galactosidase